MRRREVLGSLLSGSAVFAGGGLDVDTDTTARDPTEIPIARRGSPSDICERSIRPNVGIRAVTDPAFGSNWRDVAIADAYAEDGALPADHTVIGLDRDGWARAYPVAILRRHEIVNDTLGEPLLVTLCPICNSALVATRRVNGRATDFLVSGLLWEPPTIPAAAEIERGNVSAAAPRNGSGGRTVAVDANLVMYDELTGSYWSQLLARALCGPETGETLAIVPFSVTTWGSWLEEHPTTDVLLPPPHSEIA